MNCVMDNVIGLQYKAVAEMKLFSSCFRQLYCVMAAGFAPGPYKATWSGELSDKYTATIYVYCNNGRRYCGY